ncbi:MAG TPA: HD domain-containing phosphohydrolase [Gaiellaceae bacterium]|jgi:response regulator RpfG family c-di-GMP phosphodiesterase|nr:HD domain-containing phosphohydrolase [Gaiellaceae bacterium]
MFSWFRRDDYADEASVDIPLRRAGGAASTRILVVDDDENLRALLRTSFEMADVAVEEAGNATEAARRIAEQHPDVIVLDVGMPGVDGITFCRGLKSDPRTRDIPVVLLTGDADAELAGWQAGAGAFLRKPFSPLALLGAVERLAADSAAPEPAASPSDKQLLMYAQDFRHLLELERAQRHLLQDAYRETVTALAHALESKDGATGAHSERVRRYGTELARAVDPYLLEEPSLEYGFILHDVGKIAIPDAVLRKLEPLTDAERRLLQMHPKLGQQMVGKAALLRGHGVDVVRSHHERWDGRGYPDGLAGEEIPLPARIFAVADALDAITSDRPYSPAREWEDAVEDIVAHSGTQFDPTVVSAFLAREEALRRIFEEFNVAGREWLPAFLREAAPPEDEY